MINKQIMLSCVIVMNISKCLVNKICNLQDHTSGIRMDIYGMDIVLCSSVRS
jgi:hypothetical protein